MSDEHYFERRLLDLLDKEVLIDLLIEASLKIDRLENDLRNYK
jgi:hypothetical protein